MAHLVKFCRAMPILACLTLCTAFDASTLLADDQHEPKQQPADGDEASADEGNYTPLEVPPGDTNKGSITSRPNLTPRDDTGYEETSRIGASPQQ